MWIDRQKSSCTMFPMEISEDCQGTDLNALCLFLVKCWFFWDVFLKSFKPKEHD